MDKCWFKEMIRRDVFLPEAVGRWCVVEKDERSSREDSGEEPTDRQLTWVSHPVRTSRKKMLLFVVVVALTAVFLYLNTGSAKWAMISIVILSLGVYDFLLPTYYRLSDEGVERRVLFHTRKKSWSNLRSYYPDRNGVFLSPFPQRSRLEGFRGLYVRFGDNRREVVSFIEEHIGRGVDERG